MAGGDAALDSQRDVRELLEELLKAKNPGYRGGAHFEMREGIPIGVFLANQPISDISMFKDLPLMALELTGTQVADISALEKMPLRALFIEDTLVEDLFSWPEPR